MTNNHFLEKIGNKQQIFCDPVHGQISFNSLCLKIIDTPEFQRLRFIKQLGFVYTVYPGANNNRFEHSLGVAHLCRKFLLELRNNQPELNITDEDICCVEIAGLCHDLGHGPFSHSWETFMEKSRELRNDDHHWKHEDASIKIFDYLVKKYALADEFKKFGIDYNKISFIKNLIKGKITDDKQAFLYQIVNNEESGLDVDKWDYYLRDCYYLGIKCGFEYKRLMQFARVINVNGRKIICFRDKVLSSVYGMFRTRSELHHVAYQHRMAKRIEGIICEALIKADGKVIAPNGKSFKFYDWTIDVIKNNDNADIVVKNYCMLTDYILYYTLKYSKIGEISNAIDIVERRFQNSKLYQTVSSWNITEKINKDSLKKDIISCIRELITKKNKLCLEYKRDFNLLDMENFYIQIISIDWGKGEENPVNFVSFYSKDNMDKAFKWKEDEAKWMVPKIFKDIRLSIICNRNDDDIFEILKMACEKYRMKNSI